MAGTRKRAYSSGGTGIFATKVWKLSAVVKHLRARSFGTIPEQDVLGIGWIRVLLRAIPFSELTECHSVYFVIPRPE